jgi:diguanylate cyclase (GGDEF)-like protein
MAYRASAMVLDETAALRDKAVVLEYQLQSGNAPGPDLGLPNRKALRAAITQALSLTTKASHPTTVLLIEVDQVQDVDRIMGDEIADDLMRLVAQRLQSAVPPQQLLAYLGHNEFGLLMTRLATPQEVQQQALRMQRALDAPIAVAGLQFSVATRIGAAIASGSDMEPETLMRRAEVARYAARAEGCEYLLYRPEFELESAGKLSLAAELHTALMNDGLELLYAPQLNLAENRVDRLRVCPRWPHPRLGTLLEKDFLGLPERGGILHSLTLWMLQEALARLEDWRRGIHPTLCLTLHLPEAAFGRMPVAETVERLLAAHDLPGGSLVIEVSEASLRDGGEQARRNANNLSRLGVGLCLDDFGGPRCGVATLIDYPITDLRIFPELLARAGKDARAGVALTALLSMRQQMGLQATACGVDEPQPLNLLRGLGCQRVEGSIVRTPMTAAETPGWLQARPAGGAAQSA